MPIAKPWTTFAAVDAASLPGYLGVYEIGDAEGRVLYIGYAGGRSLYGLRGSIAAHFADTEVNPALRDRAVSYRYEVNQMYNTRHIDLLMRFREDEGRVPEGNEASAEPLPRLGRFHWKSVGSRQ